MKIILNGREFPLEKKGENSEMTVSLEETLKKDNMVVRSVSVNDVEMVNVPLAEVLGGASPGHVIRIEAIPAGELTAEALRDAADYIPRLRSGLERMRERLLEGDNRQVGVMVDQALEGLDWLGLAFQAYLEQNSHPSEQEIFLEEYSGLALILRNMEKALKEHNFERVCALFEEKVTSFLDKLLSLAEKLLAEEKQR